MALKERQNHRGAVEEAGRVSSRLKRVEEGLAETAEAARYKSSQISQLQDQLSVVRGSPKRPGFMLASGSKVGLPHGPKNPK